MSIQVLKSVFECLPVIYACITFGLTLGLDHIGRDPSGVYNIKHSILMMLRILFDYIHIFSINILKHQDIHSRIQIVSCDGVIN